MVILISPVGNSDPDREEYKGHPAGPILAICEQRKPDHVVLLPTQVADGKDTMHRAELTRDFLGALSPSPIVEIVPVKMSSVFDYREAQETFGTKLIELADRFKGHTLLVNVTSGTPAIMLACMAAISEQAISAEPIYVEDPTKSGRAEADRVRRLDVTFLRVRSLRRQAREQLTRGEFALAGVRIRELRDALVGDECRRTAGLAARVVNALADWHERDYAEAQRKFAVVKHDWPDAPAGMSTWLATAIDQTQNLASNRPSDGSIAWDIYYQSERLRSQSHRCAAIEHYWIAIEAATYERLWRKHGVPDNDQIPLAARMLSDRDPAVKAVWDSLVNGGPLSDELERMRRVRNRCVHRGHAPTTDEVERTRLLAFRWLPAAGSPEPSHHPLKPSGLAHVASTILDVIS